MSSGQHGPIFTQLLCFMFIDDSFYFPVGSQTLHVLAPQKHNNMRYNLIYNLNYSTRFVSNNFVSIQQKAKLSFDVDEFDDEEENEDDDAKPETDDSEIPTKRKRLGIKLVDLSSNV